MSKSHNQTDLKNDNSNEDNLFGFILAIVIIISGLILFFFPFNFGNELIIRTISIPIVFFGIVGIGIELTNLVGEKGLSITEFGIGLAFISTTSMLNVTFTFFPNLLVLLGIMIGILFFSSSILKFINMKKNSVSLFIKVLFVSLQVIAGLFALYQIYITFF